MVNADVMQATGNDHDQIRKVVFRVSKHILHNARTLDAGKSMFDLDTNLGQLAVLFFLTIG